MKKKIISSTFLFCMTLTIFSNYATPILQASESEVKTELFNYNDGEYTEVNLNYFEESIFENNIIDNGDGLKLNLSEFERSLLDESDIEQVNKNIEYINNGLDTGVLVYDESGDIVDAGGYEAITGQAGQTKVVFNWNYIDVYLSSYVVFSLIGGTTTAGGIGCSYLTSGVGTGACLFAAGYVATYIGLRTAERYPNGIAIRAAKTNRNYTLVSWWAQ